MRTQRSQVGVGVRGGGNWWRESNPEVLGANEHGVAEEG